MAREPIAIIVEDDIIFGNELQDFLKSHAISTILLHSLTDILHNIKLVNSDIIILDQFVGRADALEKLSDLRCSFSGGVVILSGNSDPADRVLALERGADDYIAKSLDPREILARIRAVLRRVKVVRTAAETHQNLLHPGAEPDDDFTIWNLTAWAPDGLPIGLTPTEARFLAYFIHNPGRIVSRAELSENVLKREYSVNDRHIDVIVCKIRKRIGPHMQNNPAITCVRGRGYICTIKNDEKSLSI